MAIVTFTPQLDKGKISGGLESALDIQPIRQAPPSPSQVLNSEKITRQSIRLKGKVPVHYVTGSPVPAPHQNKIPLFRAGIDSLVNQFPYPHFTDNEIMTMFNECGFSLGTDEKIRLKMIKYFRTLSKQ
jgi:hypothetical protein